MYSNIITTKMENTEFATEELDFQKDRNNVVGAKTCVLGYFVRLIVPVGILMWQPNQLKKFHVYTKVKVKSNFLPRSLKCQNEDSTFEVQKWFFQPLP
jgi:hypothetical protein